MKACLLFLVAILMLLSACKQAPSDSIPLLQKITFTPDSLSIPIGTIKQLNVTRFPQNSIIDTALTYSSSDSTIVSTGRYGLLTGKKQGIAVITVKSLTGHISKTCFVTVGATSGSGVLLNKSVTSIIIGKSDSLMATVTPKTTLDKTVVWSSSNTMVATVSQVGKISAIGVGKATITAYNAYLKVSATCTVTVTPVKVTGITISKTKMQLIAGVSYALSDTIKPANATNTDVVWSSSDTAIAKVDAGGKVTGLKPGQAIISVKLADGSLAALCVVTVKDLTSLIVANTGYGPDERNPTSGETVFLNIYNNSAFPIILTKYVIYNTRVVAFRTYDAGETGFMTINAASSSLAPLWSQTYATAEPGDGNAVKIWPVVVYFSYDGINYKMSVSGVTETIVTN